MAKNTLRSKSASQSTRTQGDRPQVAGVLRRAVRSTVDMLENRRLFALVGIQPLMGYPELQTDTPGVVSYTAGTGLAGTMATSSTTIAVITAPGQSTTIAPSDKVTMGANFTVLVNKADGSLAGGISGWDLEVRGKVTVGTTTYDGVLLRGEIEQFGFAATGTSFDYRFTLEDGLLASNPAFLGKDLGVTLSNAPGRLLPAGFSTNFTGGPKAVIAPIEKLTGLSGNVYYDANDNGQRDDGATGIGGTTVTLTGNDYKGRAVSVVTTTAPDGSYNFSNLFPSDSTGYTVTETQPANYLDGKDTAGTVNGATVGTAGNDVITSVVLTGGNPGKEYNFGEVLPASISGHVYYDANNNGVREGGEAAIGGATITLTGTDDLGNPVSMVATTAADGSYSFSGFRPSSSAGYTVTETQPAGYLDGKDSVGSLNGVGGNDVTSSIVVNPNDAGVNYDFGEILAASISGYVYADSNDNGLRDDGPVTGIGGVTVTLTGTDDLGNPVSMSTTTAADGSYSFGGLRPSSGAGYTLAETQPTDYLDGLDAVGSLNGTLGNDVLSAIPVSAGDAGVEYNFGEILPADVSGHVWYDVNDNGIRESGEPLLPGVTITLTGTDNRGGGVNLTAVTDSYGYYEFAGLRPGTYSLTEAQPAGYLDGRDTLGTVSGGISGSTPVSGSSGNDSDTGISLPQASSGRNYDFGEILASSLSGYVYYDANNDGTFQGSESPIAGTAVTLTGTDDNNQPVTASTTTDSSGFYKFSGLRPGTYSIAETQPAGYLDGKDTIGTPGGSTANDQFSAISLNAGVDGVNNNFGEILPGSLSGFVYVDGNNNGLKESGETALSGVTLTLSGTDDLGAVSLTTTTDANGFYQFTGLRPGTYTVTEAQPSNYLDGLDAKNNVVIAGSGTTDVVSTIGVAQNADSPNNNFGELVPASLSGNVYYDLNNDGVFQNTESGIVGATVTLTGTDDQGNPVSIVTTTIAGGAYSFTGLRPGTYAITETQPAGYVDGKDTIGTPGGSTSNDQFSQIVLGSGVNGVNNNFGEVKLGSLSGYVYADANDNGAKEGGETAISGVTLTLTGTDDLGAVTTRTTTTDSGGFYQFTGLRPGTYTVTETQPSNYLDGLDSRNGSVIDGSRTTDVVSTIGVAQNADSPNNNFGELVPASLSGFVYYDANNDGVFQSGETGIVGATVTLTGTDDMGNPVSVVATTVAGGAYTFAGLRPGTYAITETQPAGYVDGKDTIGTPGGTTGSDQFSAISLNAGVNGVNNNFGEIKLGSLSGYVYADTNNDGLKASGEAPIVGVTLTLTGTDDLGVVTTRTTTTNSSGFYQFAGLRPGTYTVTETQPSSYLDGKDARNNVVIAGSATTDVVSTIGVAQNADSPNNNFGELLPGSLSGFVYVDANNNGLKETGETALSGVTLTLSGTDDLGAVATRTATTAPDGSYSFGNLRPGTYTVNEAQPAGYNDGLDARNNVVISGSNVTDVVAAIGVVAGANSPNNNFGELVKTSSISGTKFLDITGNGMSADDTGLGGVTIRLYRDANSNGTVDSTDPLVSSVVTNPDGTYSFLNVANGKYLVQEVVPTGYVRTGPTNTDTYCVTITTGSTVTGLNFANYLTGCSCSLSNVYYVINNKTVVTDLRGNTDQGDTITAYFTVRAGSSATLSLVSYTAPQNYFDSNTAGQQSIYDLSTGTFTAPSTGAVTYSMTVLAPTSNYQVDFVCGYAIDKLGPANSNIFYSAQNRLISADNDGSSAPVAGVTSLSGFVFVDDNNDGDFDTNESPIAGVLVKLSGTADDGTIYSNVTSYTDSDGKYAFVGLKPGTYSVVEVQPSAYLDGKDALGTNGGNAANDAFSAIRVKVGDAATQYNFGELNPGSISGMVYVDNNNDGVVNATEKGISGVLVTLTGTNDLGQSVTLTDTTDSQGNYSFDGLRPGTYKVVETPPAAYNDGKDTVGTLGGSASVNDAFSSIVVTSGDSGINYNFGELSKTGTSTGTLCAGMTATIGYWQNNNGQDLITNVNGSCNSKSLGNWLAVTFPNLYGSSSCYSTANKTNTQIAAMYKTVFAQDKTAAQAFSLALAAYVTDSDLAGTVAKGYGFKVSSAGTAGATFNVGSAGAALGLTNNGTYSILQILKAVDSKSSAGKISPSNSSTKSTINTLLTNINETGDIS